MTKNDTSSLVCPDFYYDNITGIILNEQKNSVSYLYLAYENAIKSGKLKHTYKKLAKYFKEKLDFPKEKKHQ